jgi:hypothetical protein
MCNPSAIPLVSLTESIKKAAYVFVARHIGTQKIIG